MITALQQSVLPRTLSAEPPSDDHNNTKRHQRKTSSLGNGGESKQTLLNKILSGTQPRQLVAGRNQRFGNYPCPDHQGCDDITLNLVAAKASNYKSCLHFLLQTISPTTSLSTVPDLWITLYVYIIKIKTCRLRQCSQYEGWAGSHIACLTMNTTDAELIRNNTITFKEYISDWIYWIH
jgi:hypothetical protein